MFHLCYYSVMLNFIIYHHSFLMHLVTILARLTADIYSGKIPFYAFVNSFRLYSLHSLLGKLHGNYIVFLTWWLEVPEFPSFGTFLRAYQNSLRLLGAHCILYPQIEYLFWCFVLVSDIIRRSLCSFSFHQRAFYLFIACLFVSFDIPHLLNTKFGYIH